MNNHWLARWKAPSGAFFLIGTALAQSPSQDASDVLRQVHAECGAPALSAAVWAEGDIAWADAAGQASLELAVPAHPDHRFRLASVSKVVTAAVVGRLLDRGDFELDADVRDYVPSFPEKSGTVTPRLLLGHLAGVRHYNRSDMDLMAPGGIIDLHLYPDTASALAIFRDDPLIAEPGTRYAYSTFAFTLLGAAIESATAGSFAEALAAEVAEPLGLSSFVLEDVRAIVPGRVSYYDVPQPLLGEPNDGGTRAAFFSNPAYKWPGGGILATPSDLARFGAAHLQPGFLSEETLQQMMTPQQTTAGKSTGVGLAWRIGEDGAGRRIWHHAGNQAGTRAVLVVWPDHGVTVAVCSNRSNTPSDILTHGQAIAAPFLRE